MQPDLTCCDCLLFLSQLNTLVLRNASKQKVPFVLIAGEDDAAKNAVSFRFRDGSQDNGVPVDEAVARIVEAVRSRVQV